MRNLQKLNNQEWVELVKKPLTALEIAEILSGDTVVIAASLAGRKNILSSSELVNLENILLSNSDPKMTEFISCDISVNNGTTKGIINYRIGNTHIQKRFTA